MIIVRLMGGLGNQMFQYAAARCLALRHASELKLDITSLVPPRKYELDRLMVSASIAIPEEIDKLMGNRRGRPKFINKISEAFTVKQKLLSNSYSEPHFHYDAGLLNSPDNIYIDGYWQSQKYFMEIERTIRVEFRMRDKANDANVITAAHIRAVNSVSMHIRRGDYAKCRETREVHGLCPLNYYKEAARIISERVSSPEFFLFSDDPAWVRKNVIIDAPMTIVSHNGPERGAEDLRLMSLCRHHIIANSSFSWWGAWSNPNPQKIVIAPQQWFNNSEYNTVDLLPTAWIKI